MVGGCGGLLCTLLSSAVDDEPLFDIIIISIQEL